MIIGVPKEIKNNENRVAVTPAGVREMVAAGHRVYVQATAGNGSGFTDDEYRAAGAEVLPTIEAVYETAEMIVKVKEPIRPEYKLIRRGQVVFTYFHFASDRELTEAMIASGAVCIAYETVRPANGSLPLRGGKPAKVLILGAGVVGRNAALMAAGLGAEVTITDISLPVLRHVAEVMPKNVKTLFSSRHNIEMELPTADLVIGSVLIPGAKAPHLVTRDMLKMMRPGSLLVDVAIDQGGCFETSHPTTHSDPTYVVDGIVHYAVANIPGAVPFTSTLALTNATLPYALALAGKGWEQACRDDAALREGVNVVDGKVVYPAVAEAWNLPLSQLEL